MKLSGLLAVLLAVIPAAAVAAAEKPPPACPLLKAADIDAALGIEVGEAHETDVVIPSGPAKGETMTGCMWGIGTKGMINISLIRTGPAATRDAGIAKLREGIERLKAKGWQHQETIIGGTHCGTLVPPKEQAEHLPVAVGCMAEARGWAIGVSAMIAKTQVAPEKVKALFDAAVARLP